MEVTSPSDESVARWRGALDGHERAQADRHRVPAARVTYIAAHALTRALLAQAGSLAPSEWRFVTGKRDKPAIDPALGSNLRFNLSHTFGLVAAAVCAEHDLGVDVEACDRRSPGLKIAERFFAPSEVGIVRDAGEHRTETFFRIWTLKESYIKATGEGFARSLQSFSFTLDPVTVAFSDAAGDDPADWQFFEARPTRRHCLAVAVHRPASEVGRAGTRFDWHSVSPDNL